LNVNISYRFNDIVDIIGGKVVQQVRNDLLGRLLIDSRKLLGASNTIFFCLNSSSRNSDQFIKELYGKGVAYFVIEHEPDLKLFPNANIILVKNSLNALQLLASHHRAQFHIPVIGITGSNGKTIVKEWLHQLLQEDFNIVRNPKSYNSQVGVPLSVLQIRGNNDLAIFEAGISEPGEMSKLEKMIHPSLGIFTNIGEAHSEGFKNNIEKINEKLKLFKNVEILIYCSDNKELAKAVKAYADEKKLSLFSWGSRNKVSLKITSKARKGKFSTITAIYQEREVKIVIPFTDEASIENAIHCWCIMLLFHFADEKIAQKMTQLQHVEMRLELNQGINNCSIINDSYSSDINSLQIALDFLQQQKQHKKHTLILSDILQSGKNDKELYQEVAAMLKHKNITRLIAIGPSLYNRQESFSFLPEKHFFTSVEDFKKDLHQLYFHNEAVLLKGARIFEFEQLNNMLEQKAHQTILSINLTALAHNLKQYKKILHHGTKMMGMVKAFSYGSGSYEIAQLLQFNKVDYLAVAYTDEGVELRKAGITMPIMVMNPEEGTFNSLIQYFLEPELFSFSILSSFEKYLQSSALTNFPVHIKLDTGMHRLGFETKDIDMLAEKLKNTNCIKVQSVFSHLVASEDKEKDAFTQAQYKVFNESCKILENALKYTFLKHIANTSAISRHLNMQMDMVRLGIGLYGVDHQPQMQSKLQNVSTLSTTISQLKRVKEGDNVGYGGEVKLKKDSIIATVRIGYADGYPRALSNGVGKMLIKNKLVPVVGNVCMDMTMLDVSDIEDISEGDEVIVFGKDLPISKVAEWGKTISYEIMTGISQRVKRVYFEE
jgi:Alr-MurF fusion protein